MNAKEAWKLVEAKLPEYSPECAIEFDNSFAFSLKKKSDPHGVMTGLMLYFVNKKTREITVGTLADYITTNKPKNMKTLDPDNL